MKSLLIIAVAVLTIIVLAARVASQLIEPDASAAYVCVDQNPDGTPCTHPTHEP